MKKLLCLMIFLFIGIISVTAMEFDLENVINITEVRCLELNNTPCGDSINCNITVINKSGAFLFTNATMDVQPNGYRSFNTELNFTLETYLSCSVDCDNGGTEEFIIKIGETISDWQTAFVMGLIGLIFIYALMGFIIFSKEYWIIKTSFFAISLLLCVVLVNSAKIVSVGTKADSIMTTSITIAIVTVSVIFLYLFIFMFINIIKALKEKKGVRWR